MAAVRGPQEQRLDAEYYDTDDLRLIRAGGNAFSYGLLYEGDACHAERLQAEARRIWGRATRRLDWPAS